MAKTSTTPTTNFTWGIANLERNTADGMVQTIHYVVDARSSDGAYTSGAYGSVGLEPANPDSMVPYADLTPEQCVSWVQEKLGGAEKVSEIEAALQAQIDEQRAPTKAAGVPWATAA